MRVASSLAALIITATSVGTVAGAGNLPGPPAAKPPTAAAPTRQTPAQAPIATRPRAISEGGNPAPGSAPIDPARSAMEQLPGAPAAPSRNASDARGSRGTASRNPGMETARQHYDAAGYPPQRAEQHMRGIDPRRPVDVVHLPEGTKLYQYVPQGTGRVGNYYADTPPPAPPRLGISGQDRAPVQFEVPPGGVRALRSTAGPVVDTWTGPGQPVPVPGGGIQYHIPAPNLLPPSVPQPAPLAGYPRPNFPVERRQTWPGNQSSAQLPGSSAELRQALERQPQQPTSR